MFVNAGRVQYGQIIWSYLSEGKSWKVPQVMEADSGICYYLMDMERWIHHQRTGIRMKGIRGIILRHFSFRAADFSMKAVVIDSLDEHKNRNEWK